MGLRTPERERSAFGASLAALPPRQRATGNFVAVDLVGFAREVDSAYGAGRHSSGRRSRPDERRRALTRPSPSQGEGDGNYVATCVERGGFAAPLNPAPAP